MMDLTLLIIADGGFLISLLIFIVLLIEKIAKKPSESGTLTVLELNIVTDF